MRAYVSAKGEAVLGTLSSDAGTQSGQDYANNSIVEILHGGGRVVKCESGDVCPTWRRETKHHEPLILETEMETEIQETTGPMLAKDGRGVHSQMAGEGKLIPEGTQYHYAVRRITPIEGERLQGFSDGWTRPCFTPTQITDALIDRFVAIHQQWAAINGKPNAKPKSREWVRKWLTTISSPDCPDGPRYKAIGNSMSVNVMMWIGMRIQQEEDRNPTTSSDDMCHDCKRDGRCDGMPYCQDQERSLCA